MIDLTDRTAVVTGAGRGIGRAIAVLLAEQGANVAVGDIVEDREDTAAEIEESGGTARAYEMDVTDREMVDSVFEDVQDTFAGIDILVNNAGVFPASDLDTMSEEDWKWVIDVNLTGAWHCTQSALSSMRSQKYGRIVNVASIAGGQIGWGPDLSHYAASKAGMVGFTKSAAIAVAPDNITMNAILPGYIETNAARETMSEEEHQAVIQMTPVGRGGAPEEIAYAVAMMASEQAGFMTGASLVVDGGITLV